LEHSKKILTYKGRVVFEKLRLPYFDGLVPKEYFENEACFIFVNEGEITIKAQTENLHLKKGSGLLAKCMNYFVESNNKQPIKGEGIEVIGLLMYPELVKDLFDFNILKSNHTVNYNLKEIEVNKLLEHYKCSIDILIENPDLADETLIQNKLKEFIILMTKTVNAPSELDFLSAMFKPNFALFEAVIQFNLYSNMALEELATLCHMSLSSFKRKFKEMYSESPIKYLSKMKIERAKELLQNKDFRVSDIAYDTGFESLTTFNRSFKSQTGRSPSEYRLNQID
jgi:AraC-like DNA-binding protein